jgi:hypothetical protein
MFRKMLLVFALAAAGLVGSCTLLLGGAAYRDASSNKGIAVLATRELARAWNVRDLRPYFTANAIRRINFDQAQASMNGLKPLGSGQRRLSHESRLYQRPRRRPLAAQTDGLIWVNRRVAPIKRHGSSRLPTSCGCEVEPHVVRIEILRESVALAVILGMEMVSTPL